MTSATGTLESDKTDTEHSDNEVNKKSVTSSRQAAFTAPSLSTDEGIEVGEVLQTQLISLIDLGLTLKHIHWNVVGPYFIGVHEMLDLQYAGVLKMIDDVAERIATLGGVPNGLPGRVVQDRTWDDYELGRAHSIGHLGALDLVYQGVISGHRSAMDAVADVDRVSEDLLTGQSGILERYHWLVRSHLSDFAGGMANAGATTEVGAAASVAAKVSRSATRSADPTAS